MAAADCISPRDQLPQRWRSYLFRTTAGPALARRIFLDYLARVNSLHQKPEWYNALTNNWTTNIAVTTAEARNQRPRLDWRILLNGKMDEMMYQHGGLMTGGLPLAALKDQAHIDPKAKAANDRSDFSEVIREGRVGFPEDASQKWTISVLRLVAVIGTT
jgi:hypothetical protein